MRESQGYEYWVERVTARWHTVYLPNHIDPRSTRGEDSLDAHGGPPFLESCPEVLAQWSRNSG